MLLKLRKPILKYTFIKNHVHLLCLFKTSQSAYQYLPLRESVIVLCFVVGYFMSILVLQSS